MSSARSDRPAGGRIVSVPWAKRTPLWRVGRRVVREISLPWEVARLPEPDPTRPALLVANHFFDGEIAALENSEAFDRRFQVIPLSPRAIFNVNWSLFPEAVWSGDQPYVDNTLVEARRKSAAFAERLLDMLRRRYDVAGVATPSDAFFWVREFLRVASRADIPTFVFDKEGVVSPATFDNQPGLIAARYPPLADHFYVWNRRQVAYWQDAGLEPDRVNVLGSLRSDLFVSMPPASEPAVLLFDFDTNAYLEDLADPAGTAGGWADLKKDLHLLIRTAARRYPDIRFTVKCHPQQTDIASTRADFAGSDGRVEVLTGSVDVHDIVQRHSLVLGFQTTALLETALTTRPTIYCGWGELHERVKHRLLPLMEPGFGQVVSPDATTAMDCVSAHLEGRSLPAPGKRDRIGEYFYDADGHVADRYLAALTEDLPMPAD